MKDYLTTKLFCSIATRQIAVLAVVLGFSSFALAKEAADTSAATIEFSHKPASLIISYALQIGEMAEVDRGPTLQIFGDGLAHVYYPAYMTRAGDYGMQLSEKEMVNVLTSLVEGGVIEFNSDAARVKAEEIDTQTLENEGTMHYITDQSTSVIEIHLVRYAPPGTPGVQTAGVNKTVRWSGLQSDAKQYPYHTEIQKLASAERMLRNLMERPDLLKLTPKDELEIAGKRQGSDHRD